MISMLKKSAYNSRWWSLFNNLLKFMVQQSGETVWTKIILLSWATSVGAETIKDHGEMVNGQPDEQLKPTVDHYMSNMLDHHP